jgi:hypothetical protein
MGIRFAFKPAVRRKWLLVLAGLLWSVVGLGLCRAAWHWIVVLPMGSGLPLAGLGAAGAVTAWRFIFSGIARKNIQRLNRLSEKPCLFAFQTWRSYFLIVFMIGLGMALRHSPVPKPWLAVAYAAVGGALVLASGGYYRNLLTK